LNTEKETNSNIDKTEWKESPYLIIKGFLMGSADIVPGVSGGTMALITGIYDRLIYAIRSVDGDLVKKLFKFRIKDVFEGFHWKFLLLLFTGILCAVAFFTRVVPLQVYMFTHPEIVYGLFFGLIVGSIVLLLVQIESEKKGWMNIVPLLGGAIFGFWVVTLVPTDTPSTPWFVMLSGSIAICAMILPGISGSYLLLILRQYDYILSQLGNLGSAETVASLLNLVPFFAGALIGIILFSRLLSWLLNRYHATTLLVLIGFLVGSLYVIWPYQEREFRESVESVEIMEYNDPVVQELLSSGEESNRPEYRRISRIINPDAAPDGDRRAEIETVSRKMLTSKPFFPEGEENDVNIGGGITGIAGGFMMILGISYLRRT